MSAAPADVEIRRFAGPDGAELAYRELGSGRPVVLLHGFFSTGYVNWIRYGHAQLLASAGHRVLMPDLRAHGASAASHDPAAYPPDVLAGDALTFLEHLGLADDAYDLGGYSLGTRTVVRMMVRGARPGRAVLAGMGLEPILDTSRGEDFFRRVLTQFGTFKHGDPEFMSQAFLKTTGADPEALVNLLDASVDTLEAEVGRIGIPTTVVMGTEDTEHGSADALAGVLRDARAVTIPGSHMGAVARTELGEALVRALEVPVADQR